MPVAVGIRPCLPLLVLSITLITEAIPARGQAQYQIGPRPSYGTRTEPPMRDQTGNAESLSLTPEVKDRLAVLLCGRGGDPKDCAHDASFGVQVPSEMRDLVISFVRQLGAHVLEAGNTEYAVSARNQAEQEFVGGVWRQKIVVTIEIRRLPSISQSDTRIVLHGRGEELHYGQDWARAMRVAGHRALLNLR